MELSVVHDAQPLEPGGKVSKCVSRKYPSIPIKNHLETQIYLNDY